MPHLCSRGVTAASEWRMGSCWVMEPGHLSRSLGNMFGHLELDRQKCWMRGRDHKVLVKGCYSSDMCVFIFFFTFICIYFLQYLFPGHKFLFLQFLPGYLFLLGSLLFWFRNKPFFFSKDHLSVARRAHVQVDPTMSSVSPARHPGGFVHLDVLNDHRIYI